LVADKEISLRSLGLDQAFLCQLGIDGSSELLVRERIQPIGAFDGDPLVRLVVRKVRVRGVFVPDLLCETGACQQQHRQNQADYFHLHLEYWKISKDTGLSADPLSRRSAPN